MDNTNCYATLDLISLLSKKSTTISSQEALKNIIPINWEKDSKETKKKEIKKNV